MQAYKKSRYACPTGSRCNIVQVLWRTDRRSKKNHSPIVTKTKTTLQRINQKKEEAMFQMKGQDKTPEKQLNEVEIGNLPEKNSE